MKLLSDSRARGGMLILALACVGGTGCAIIDAASQAHYRQQQQDAEAARQRRIAALAPAAERGDAAARSALAYALLSPSGDGRADAPRALALLEQAARQDDGMAQALLGAILSGARVGTYQHVPAPPQDIARGTALLQRAATKACVYRPGPAYFRIEPAQRAAQSLAGAGRRDDARLWRARAILHCGGANASYLSWQAKSASVAPAQRIDALALLTLTGDAKACAEARSALPAEDAAAAERLAADLRRQVAASERDYPAPPRKDYP